jgi:predicted N-acyltransferase
MLQKYRTKLSKFCQAFMFLVVSKENKRKVLRKERKKVTKERNKRNSGIKDYRDKRKIKENPAV